MQAERAPWPPEPEASLRDALADRLSARHVTWRRLAEAVSFSGAAVHPLNVPILVAMNGHLGRALREKISDGSGGTPLVRHAASLLSETRSLAELAASEPSVTIGGDSPLCAPPPREFSPLSRELAVEALLAEAVCGRPLSGDGLIAAAGAAFGEHVQNGEQLGVALLKASSPERVLPLLRSVGVIPAAALSAKALARVSLAAFAGLCDSLRAAEQEAAVAELARHARASAIARWVEAGFAAASRPGKGRPVWLDGNGLMVDVGPLRSHLPYGFVSPETLRILKLARLLSPAEAEEAAVRAAAERVELVAAEAARRDQEAGHRARLNLGDADLVEALRREPETYLARVSGKEFLPENVMEATLSRGHEGVFLLLSHAERLAVIAASEEESGAPQAAATSLRKPAYYAVSRIARAVALGASPSDVAGRYILARGFLGVSRAGDRQQVLFVLWRRMVAQVALAPDRHLSGASLAAFEALPDLGRGGVETLLFAAQEFRAAAEALARFSSQPAPLDRDRVENFALANVTASYRSLREANDAAFSAAAEEALSRYEYFFYRSADAGYAEVRPAEIFRFDVEFGPTFALAAAEALPAGAFDAALSAEPASARFVAVRSVGEDPSLVIPGHLEESCLDGLRLLRGRPLANVVAGARHVGDGARAALDSFAASVARAAHRVLANVAVAGTQSGAGISFGWAAASYSRDFGHLPWRDRAHFFAVSPGEDVFVVGSPLFVPKPKGVYAATLVDQVLTPATAGWGASVGDEATFPYHAHVAYMEALYSRVSRGAPHVVVLGNGGFYSLLEVEGALSRGASLLVVAGTGRLADVLAAGVTEENPASDPAAFISRLRAALPADVVDEFVAKDFGDPSAAPSLSAAAYRARLAAVIAHPATRACRVTNLEALEEDLCRALLVTVI